MLHFFMTRPERICHLGRLILGIGMDRLLVKMLLTVAAVLVAALVMDLFSGPARGIALSSAGLFCLFACRPRQRSEKDIHTAHAPADSLPAPEAGA